MLISIVDGPARRRHLRATPRLKIPGSVYTIPELNGNPDADLKMDHPLYWDDPSIRLALYKTGWTVQREIRAPLTLHRFYLAT